MTTTAQEATGIDYAKLRDLAMEMNEAGLTVPAIARELELPRSTIYAWLPKGNDGSRAARMAQMREQGMTNKEIAARFNITRQRVSAILGPSARRGRPADPRTAVRVRLSSRDVEQVVAVAERLGLRITSGAEAGRGSINALLEEIAAGNLRVAWRDGRTAYTRLIES
jgi:orotate phosphoribosyltransferase-like protein